MQTSGVHYTVIVAQACVQYTIQHSTEHIGNKGVGASSAGPVAAGQIFRQDQYISNIQADQYSASQKAETLEDECADVHLCM